MSSHVRWTQPSVWEGSIKFKVFFVDMPFQITQTKKKTTSLYSMLTSEQIFLSENLNIENLSNCKTKREKIGEAQVNKVLQEGFMVVMHTISRINRVNYKDKGE